MTQLDSPEDVAVAAHRALAAAGLSDMIWGHASVRLPDGSGIETKSSGWSFEEITTQRLVRVAWDGRRLAGDGTVHIEVPIHTQIMAARPDVEAVVHTHAPAVTAFASLGVPMRAISHDGVPFASQLPRFERSCATFLQRQRPAAQRCGPTTTNWRRSWSWCGPQADGRGLPVPRAEGVSCHVRFSADVRLLGDQCEL